MSVSSWRSRAATGFRCEKQPALGRRGMVVTNHPLASAAGAEMLAAGGNAVDAAVAALFTLSVVEPMMVGLLGGGMAHLRLADGRHVVMDGQATVPRAGRPDMFPPKRDAPPGSTEAEGRVNQLGALAMAAPGSLRGWCDALARFGTFPLADVMEPAIRHAARGFRVTPYLSDCIGDAAPDMDAAMRARFLPEDSPLRPGTRLVQPDTAETLRLIAQEGPEALHGGAIGRIVADQLARRGGIVTQEDLAAARTIAREPVRGQFRGHEIVGPPPPSSGGVHVIQMLNILEGYDLAAMGFGSAEASHLILEALKIAFADRAAATADPAFVQVPVARLTDKSYAAERRAAIDPDRARAWSAAVAPGEGADTTHLTVADGDGNVVASTQTINSLFGARLLLPEVGLIPNNYMALFDPVPGRAQSIAPGKRISTSMSPVMALRDGRLRFALGLPGGLKIFGSAMQALVNLLEHGMSLQEAVEAPRLWTQGQQVEIEPAYGEAVRAALSVRGHALAPVLTVGGGMNAIALLDDGLLEGAACWRADGTPIGVGGGLARPGVRFRPEARQA